MIDRRQIELRLARLPALEAEMATPGAAAQPRRFRALVREHAALKRLAEKADRRFALAAALAGHRTLLSDPLGDPDLVALAREELPDLEADAARAEQELLLAVLPPDPVEERNAVMEIRAGTGGEEAALFAADLYRMYTRFCDRRGLKLALVDASASDIGGYKEIVFMVNGAGAFGLLQYECGVHRVQRVPVTEASGRIHTSAATVAVFPEADAEDDIAIPPEEVRLDLFCSSGAGGQSVNTTYSAVRLTHLPTGIVVQCQDERSQHRNKEKALAVLKARLLDERRREEARRQGGERRAMIGSGDRSERIRTYNFPQNRLTDHRVNLTLYSLDRIIEGELDAVVEALRADDLRARLAREFQGGDHG